MRTSRSGERDRILADRGYSSREPFIKVPATYIIHSHATWPGTIVCTLHRGEHAQRTTCREKEKEKARERDARQERETEKQGGDRGRGR